MSVIGPVQSHYRKGSPVCKRSMLRWERFVEKISLSLKWKSVGVMGDESGMMTEMGWQVDEEVNREQCWALTTIKVVALL